MRKRMRQLAEEHGYTLIEMLTVLIILGVVMGGLTTLFVQGSNAEVDMNNRFQAQGGARLALDKIRREVHCASVATTPLAPTNGVEGPTNSTTLTLPACPTGNGAVTWCTSGSGTRWKLYRYTAGSCTGGVKWADYLVSGNVFTYSIQSSSSLAKLRVDLTVNPLPAKALENYELTDDIFFRNSTRTCILNSPSPPC